MFKIDTRVMAPDPAPAGDPPDGDPPAGDPPAGDPPPTKTLMGDPPAGDPPPAGDDAWAWGENVPGTGTVPPWLKADKFKTVSDQAKAFTDLETKIGPAAELIGAPEGEYVLPGMPEGVTGEWDIEDGMLVGFQKVAKEMGLSQAAFDKVTQSMAGLLAVETAANETAVSDALAELGTNSAARIEAVKGFLTTKLGADGYELLNDSIGTNVKAYLSLEKLVSLAAGDAQLSGLPGKQGPGFSKEDIGAERYKVYPEGAPLAGQIMYEHDKEHRAKVDNMYKELFPGEDVQTVG